MLQKKKKSKKKEFHMYTREMRAFQLQSLAAKD